MCYIGPVAKRGGPMERIENAGPVSSLPDYSKLYEVYEDSAMVLDISDIRGEAL